MDSNKINNLFKLLEIKHNTNNNNINNNNTNNNNIINPSESLLNKINNVKKTYKDLRLHIKNIEKNINNIKN